VMIQIREKLKLYLVMGSANCPGDPRQVLEEAIRGGITLFQFREKGPGALTGEEKIRLAVDLKEICHRHGIPFIFNDDVDMALEVGADGVHIGQEDLPVALVRKKIGSKILGVSAHNVEEARQAEEAGADYLGVGPMYPTFTKPDIREVRGPVVIEEIRRAGIVLPIVGIGGIGEGKAKAVTDAGADGVAVISAITQARSPYEAAKALRNEIENS
jgi:thiamine-phosphate pyrophosphorylase